MGQVIGSDNCVDLRRFPHDPNPLSIMARRGVVSTSENLNKVDGKTLESGTSDQSVQLVSYLKGNSRPVFIFRTISQFN